MYINFFPGNMRDARDLTLSEVMAYYDAGDIAEFVDSMIVGCTASISTDGVKGALEDGSIWGDLCAKYGDEAVQEALEELHALL